MPNSIATEQSQRRRHGETTRTGSILPKNVGVVMVMATGDLRGREKEIRVSLIDDNEKS